MVTSNKLQPLRLVYSHNVVTKSIAVVFVYTCVSGYLGDNSVICGIPWSRLKRLFYDGTSNVKKVYDQLTKYEKQMINELCREQDAIGINRELHVTKTKPYKEAIEKGQKYSKIFTELLKFNEVTTFVDISKAQVIEVLELLQQRADNFES